MSKGAVAGTAVACGIFMFALIYVAIFAVLRKKRAVLSSSGRENPFGKVPENIKLQIQLCSC
jgi:hypothetical protein